MSQPTYLLILEFGKLHSKPRVMYRNKFSSVRVEFNSWIITNRLQVYSVNSYMYALLCLNDGIYMKRWDVNHCNQSMVIIV